MGNTISNDVSADVEYKEDANKLEILHWSIRESMPSTAAPLVSLQTLCKEIAEADGYILNEKLLQRTFSQDTWFIKKTAELVWMAKQPLFDLLPNNCIEGWLMLDDDQGVDREYFNTCTIGQRFPRATMKERVCRIFDLGCVATVGKEIRTVYQIYIPSLLAKRIVYFYLIDSSELILMKAKAMIVSNDEFHPNVTALQSMDEREVREKKFEAKTTDKLRATLSQTNAPTTQEQMADATLSLDQPDTDREKEVYQGPSNLLSLFKQPVLRVEFQAFQNVPRAPIRHCIANDFTNLAYRSYTPDDGAYTHIVLYIAQNTFFADLFAYRLSQSYPIRVYIGEIRGYGYSGGPRGHTKAKELVYQDVRSFVRMVRYSHQKSLPLVLAGYLHTASLLLNYDSFPEKEPVEGYLFYAPNFGLEAQDTYRTNTFFAKALKEHHVKRHMGNIFLSKATGGLFKGDKPAIDISFPDEIYALTPMTVSRVTTNMLLATAATDLKSQFHRLILPFCFLVGENDEMFFPEALAKYPRLSKSKSKNIRIVPGLSNTNIQSGTVEVVGNWVVNTFDVPLSAPSAASLALRGSTCSSTTQESASSNPETLTAEVPFYHEMKELSSLTTSMLEKKLLPPVQYLESFDGTMLAYQRFAPSEGKMPTAVLILWMEWYTAPRLAEMAETMQTIIYRFDVRGTGKSSGNRGHAKSKELLWNDVKLSILFGRHNYPQHVVFAGGHSGGASMVLNYASWKEAVPANAYIFISPAAHPFSDSNVMILKPAIFDFLATKKSNSIFHWRSKIVYNSRMSDYNPDYATELSAKFIKGMFAKDILEQLLELDVPFGIWYGENDEFYQPDRIIDSICALSRAPMHASELLQGETHIGVLRAVSKDLGAWINRVATSLNPRPNALLRDCKISDVEKIELIGKGTFGRVWLVFHKKLEKYLALKVLRKDDVVRHKLIQQVIREKHLLEITINPFIVPYVGSFQDDHHLYILMEFLIGGELYTLLRLYDHLPLAWVKFYIAEILLALTYLHEHGILYRDLKPENILLDALGHVRLIDFGLAREVDPAKMCSTFCGSPFYMAPEMVSTRSYSFPADIWALGVVTYELLNGSPPFTGRSQTEIYRKILFGKIDWPNHMDPDAKDLIQKLLDQNPSKRLGCNPEGASSMLKSLSKMTMRTSSSDATQRSMSSLDNRSSKPPFSANYSQIMRHKFFKGIDWDQMRHRQATPPFQPAVKSDGDTGNFVKYNLRESASTAAPFVHYGDIFKDF